MDIFIPIYCRTGIAMRRGEMDAWIFFTQRFYDRSYATASMRSFLEIEKKQWHTCSLVHTKGGANRDTGLLFFLCLSSLSGQLVSRTMRRKRDQMVDQSRSAKLKNLPLK